MPAFNIEYSLVLLTGFATAVMAASAATQAVRCQFDPIGALFLALVTAVGGGTLRDLMIGATPVFWLQDPLYVAVAIPMALLTWLLVRRMAVGTGKRRKLLAYLDAVGLALFTLVGTRVAVQTGQAPVFAVLLGCITGIGGGIFRDVLCGMTPIVLRKDIYATLSLTGGALYLILMSFWNEQSAFLTAFVSIALTRVVVVARRAEEPD